MSAAQFIATYLEPILYGVVLLLATLVALAYAESKDRTP